MSNRSREPRAQNGDKKNGITFSIACLVLYTVVMFGVRFYAHHIGFVGGLLTIAAMLIAAHWYDHRQRRTRIEILSPERRDDHLR